MLRPKMLLEFLGAILGNDEKDRASGRGWLRSQIMSTYHALFTPWSTYLSPLQGALGDEFAAYRIWYQDNIWMGMECVKSICYIPASCRVMYGRVIWSDVISAVHRRMSSARATRATAGSNCHAIGESEATSFEKQRWRLIVPWQLIVYTLMDEREGASVGMEGI
jgi:hypothetical protein